jgi:hypothetical protein
MKEGAFMSMMQFDEIYEICEESIEKEEKVIKKNPRFKRFVRMKDPQSHSTRTLDKEVRVLLNGKKSEVSYV